MVHVDSIEEDDDAEPRVREVGDQRHVAREEGNRAQPVLRQRAVRLLGPGKALDFGEVVVLDQQQGEPVSVGDHGEQAAANHQAGVLGQGVLHADDAKLLLRVL